MGGHDNFKNQVDNLKEKIHGMDENLNILANLISDLAFLAFYNSLTVWQYFYHN